MIECQSVSELSLAERIKRQHRVWSDDPFENSPFNEFPVWMFGWGETNRCPGCFRLAWYANRDGGGELRCPKCEHELPQRWFTDRRPGSRKEDTGEDA